MTTKLSEADTKLTERETKLLEKDLEAKKLQDAKD